MLWRIALVMSTDASDNISANSARPSARPVVIIAGATAAGKSALAMLLAERLRDEAGRLGGEAGRRLGGEVVNADSMQVYRDLPILTAIPDADDRARIRHHGYAVLDGAERCSVGRWLELTRGYVEAIHGRGGIPILVGGTGMYIGAALHGLSPIPDIPQHYRDTAIAWFNESGGAGFRQELMKRDPVLASRLDDNDRQRLIRGMEVALATGIPLSVWQDKPLVGAIKADFTSIRVAPPRDELYKRIDRRFPQMLDGGGAAEAEALVKRRLDASLPVMKAVGFPQVAAFLDGTMSRDEAIMLACRDSRRYAKRQTTWFNHRLEDNFCEDSGYNEQYSESFIDRILSKIIN
jgi:tRNA dimethylallyltransferase